MNWKPDEESTVPYYKQIEQHFEKLILQGELPPGSALPPERMLAKQLGVNHSTVSAAYAELRSHGLVSSAQGSGTRVSENLWHVSPQKIINWHHFTSVSFLPMHPIRKRIREAAETPGVIDLASAGLAEDLFPHEPIKEILQLISANPKLGHTHIAGDRSFREVLADHLREQSGISAAPDEILITSGAQQALLLIAHGLLQPGDAVAIESPSYTYRLNFFTTAGIRMVPLPIDEYGLQPEDIPLLFKKYKIRMVFTNPTNQDPTGTTLSLERRVKLLQICEELRLPIIEIDFTGLLTHPGKPAPPKTLFQLQSDNGLVIHLGSLSDTLAPGIRIGWMVGSKTVIDRLAEAKHQMDRGTAAIAQQIALHFLKAGHWRDNLAKLQEKLGERRQKMEQSLALHLHQEASWMSPAGGGHLWCQLPQPISDLNLLESGIHHQVLFDPGSIYGGKHGHVRLCFSRCPEDEIEEGIRRFALAVKAAQS